MKNENESGAARETGPGDFPFPVARGPKESALLTWLRNNSNYMATRGFLDYFRMAGVLLRGILLNLLILVPALLLAALLVGHLYGPQLRSLRSAPDLPITRLESFVSRLQGERRNVDDWVAEHLSQATLAALKDPDSGPRERQRLLVQDLRRLLDVHSLYDPNPDVFDKRFEGVDLSDEHGDPSRAIAQHLDPAPHGSRLRRLNRLLLEKAYDPEIERLEGADSDAGRLFGTIALPNMPMPFSMTKLAALLALLVILLSPVAVVYRDIAGHRQSRERAGSDSSIELRDKFERTFGFLGLLILCVWLFELLPILVDRFHGFRVTPGRDWNAIFASVATVSVAVVGASSKLLSVLGGAKKKLAMVLVGFLGALAPLLVVLYVTEFIVYDGPSSVAVDGWLLTVLPGIFVVGIVLAGIIGFVKQSFERVEYLRLFGLGVGIVALTWVLARVVTWGVGQQDYQAHSWNHYFVLILMVEVWLFVRLTVDVNGTSVHGLYRDRLASAYLVEVDKENEVGIEEDVNLSEIVCREAGSIAPYHLVNVTLNLQGSKNPCLRDRNSDFFVFSKRFVGGDQTGYCRTTTLEAVHPQMNLATAMAISAAAASPNMGRGTTPAIVAVMVLLNIRLGYWLPNPGRLEEKLSRSGSPKGRAFTFDEVFAQELGDIESRWGGVYPASEQRQRSLHRVGTEVFGKPTTKHALVGLGFSGGGIRSATINLGIAQALHERGVFDHVDYMSTVSGGGYLGSSLSTLMRSRPGSASGPKPGDSAGSVRGGDDGKSGPATERSELRATVWDRFRWRVRPGALVREMLSWLDETHDWVNLSDGGHIENLAGIELLRRRCKFVIIGDGEADPDLSFNGLATLMRCAFIDQGIKIDIDPAQIRYVEQPVAFDAEVGGIRVDERPRASGEHFALGTITYPEDKERGLEEERGYLLYLKSSCTGDEGEVIQEYRHRSPAFPHESTADQFFDETQFECYRALGQHIGEMALEELSILGPTREGRMEFEEFAESLSVRADLNVALVDKALEDEVNAKWDLWLKVTESSG